MAGLNHGKLLEELGINEYIKRYVIPERTAILKDLEREGLEAEEKRKAENTLRELDAVKTQLDEEYILRKNINKALRNLHNANKNRDPTQPGETFPKPADAVRKRPHRNLASIGVPGGKHMQVGEALVAAGEKPPKPKQDRKTRHRRNRTMRRSRRRN